MKFNLNEGSKRTIGIGRHSNASLGTAGGCKASKGSVSREVAGGVASGGSGMS